jgi:hypothetical protein
MCVKVGELSCKKVILFFMRSSLLRIHEGRGSIAAMTVLVIFSSNLFWRATMKHLFLLLTFFSTTICFGQAYYRINGETARGFVERMERTSKFAHPVMETNVWDSTHKTIIYFLPAITSEGPGIIGYLLVPQNMLTYRRVLIDTIFNEGGEPHIERVVFANADRDKEQELIVMTSWPQHHPQAGLDGTLYGTYIFDNPGSAPQYELPFFKELSEKLDGGFEGKRHKEKVKAEYKAAAAIQGALRKLGY